MQATNNNSNAQIVNDPWIIGNLPQTIDNCVAAVTVDGMVLRVIKPENQTEQICLLAVKNHGYALQFVQVQTPDIIRTAVISNGFAIKFANPDLLTEELLFDLVEKNHNIIYVTKCNQAIWAKAIARKPELAKHLPTLFNHQEFLCQLIDSCPTSM